MTGGFIAWFEAIIYKKVRDPCKHILVKIIVHTLGMLLMIGGLYFLITALPSIQGIGGMILFFIGLFIFLIPLGVKKTNVKRK
jgi:hypothetical protein